MAKSSNSKNVKYNNKQTNMKNNNVTKNNSKVSSKYNRYEKYDNNSKNSKNNKSKNLEVEFLDDLDSTKNLDDSFIEGLKRRKVVEEETEILDVEEINKANTEFKESINLNNRLQLCSYLLLTFVLISLCSVSFIIYHFFDFDHKKVKVVKEEVIKEIKVVDDNYVFLGDSITYLYDLEKNYIDLPVVNSGVSGYTTKDILDRLDKMVYQYNPSKVFILIGTNDLGKEVSNETIVSNIKKIITNIKDNRPYAEIYLQSIYPVNDSGIEELDYYTGDGNRNNEEISRVNNELKKLADDENIVYIDVYSKLVNEDNLLDVDYTVDGLHLSSDGYDVITEILKKYL